MISAGDACIDTNLGLRRDAGDGGDASSTEGSDGAVANVAKGALCGSRCVGILSSAALGGGGEAAEDEYYER